MADPKTLTILLQATLLVALSLAYSRLAKRASRTWVFATVGGVLLVQLMTVVTLFVGSPLIGLSAGQLYPMNVSLVGVWLAGAVILAYEHERLGRRSLQVNFGRTNLPAP